jgi:cobyrinic acid a,c-diamide synthase
MKAFVVAGTHSGVGKTSVSVGLMAALRRRGLAVQPFKVGPDFIDPAHHQRAAGRTSRNLDGWMLSRETNVEIFARNSAGADVCIIEGVMGLFDGSDGTSEDGSTAQVAKWLDAPVVLVVDAWALSRSAAAVVKGFAEFDPGLRLAGVLFNRVGSATHLQWLTDAVRSTTAVQVLGGIPNEPAARLPERHLGLVMPDEERTAAWTDRMADLVERSVDLDGLLSTVNVPLTKAGRTGSTSGAPAQRARIGVMRDEAFCFYYQDNLDLLRSCGAELVEFSALRDELPSDLDGLYVGGGYPELLAAELSGNLPLLEGVRRFAASDHPIYAECGGLMYLSQGIEDADGTRHSLCGLFPFWTRLTAKPTLAYAEVRTVSQSVFPSGQTARGHVFHYSDIVGQTPSSRCYLVKPSHAEAFEEGFRTHNVLASYVHLHFMSNPALAESFVAACEQAR